MACRWQRRQSGGGHWRSRWQGARQCAAPIIASGGNNDPAKPRWIDWVYRRLRTFTLRVLVSTMAETGIIAKSAVRRLIWVR